MFGYSFSEGIDFDPVDIGGDAVDSTTQFSTTWGGGVKIDPTNHIGFSLKGRWTPTYIHSNPDGIFCNPFFPFRCWVVSDTHIFQSG
jgi:opacity protein-like surface antigen